MRRLLTLALVLSAATAWAQPTHVAAVTQGELRDWDARIEHLLQQGDLVVRWAGTDPLLPGRRHERLAQLHRGVPVFGGDLTRQTGPEGTVSVFGTLHQGISLDVQPGLTREQAKAAIEALAGARLGESRLPDLLVLPRDEGSYALVYRERVFSQKGLWMYFVDARTGALVKSLNDLKSDSAVGIGTGVLGDKKKVSVSRRSGGYAATDELRPPSIKTYDMKGNLFRVLDYLDGYADLGDGDLAQDSDNIWTDGADVDAHAYAGWVYDYYYKRLGRRGLDGYNLPMTSIVHPVNRNDFYGYPDWVVGYFYLNAFYAGGGIMIYGEGLPEGLVTRNGQSWNYLAGGLDIVAHELTHGVTDFTSNLIYENESGALNEAFSDIMGIAVEFFFQPPGSGSLKADYLMGEDVITPGGIRSAADPAAYGDPDHYSNLYRGPQDNGGVHSNSGIANQAFYLAIEGGSNRTSGIAVRGVGGSNREKIEKVYYRAFCFLLNSSANFATARAATVQAARELYGAGSDVEQAVSQSWTAVGVN